MKNIIEIQNLTKTYGSLTAVDNLSFKVKEGELFAFLGVNGAGKSTTINIMCSALAKDSGSVIINGNNIDTDSDKVKNDIGVVFQSSVLDKSLTVLDNLQSRGALYSLHGKELRQRIDEVARLLDFSDLLKRTVGKLSGGQRRRIDVARALLHKPKILILDEPTTGLDPQTRSLLWKVISNLQKSENMTVFLTTHYMEEAADADYVVILDGGKISADGTPYELKTKWARDTLTLYGVDTESVEGLGIPFERLGDGYKLYVSSPHEAKTIVIENGFDDFELAKGKMDDVFLAVTGRELLGGDGK